MADKNEAEYLTPPISIVTTTPFPTLVSHTVPAADGNPEKTIAVEQAGTDTVVLDVCSELTDAQVCKTLYDEAEKLVLVANNAGQPTALALRGDHHLYAFFYADGSATGWTVLDITPTRGTKKEIKTFDAFVDRTHQLHIAVASVQDDNSNIVQHCTLKLPTIRTTAKRDKVIALVDGQDVEAATLFNWMVVPNKLGNKHLSTLTCGNSAPPITKSANWAIFAGSEEDDNNGNRLTGAYFTIDPSDHVDDPWKVFSPPGTTTRCLDIQPNLVQGYQLVNGNPVQMNIPGFLVLNETTTDGDRYINYRTIDENGTPQTDSRVGWGALGKPNGITAHLNPWHLHDLFVAGDKGIGVFLFEKITELAYTIMPEVSFKQVVTSEELDPHDKSHTRISVFALSQNGDLYFFDGSRDRVAVGHPVTFNQSGLPIRQQVQRISCQYSSLHRSAQLLYSTESETKLRFLSRCSATSSWNETYVATFDRYAVQKVRACVTDIQIRSSTQTSVGAGYPVHITCEPLIALINDRAYHLGPQEIEVKTNRQGKVRLVLPLEFNQLSCPVYHIKLKKFSQDPPTHDVYAGQRVMRQLDKYTEPEHLEGLTTSTGQQPLAGKNPEDLKSAALTLQQYHGMLSTVDPAGSELVLGKPAAPAKEVSIQKDKHGVIRNDPPGDWFDEAVGAVGNFIGDCIEWLKEKFQAAFAIVLKVQGAVVRFAIKLAEKTLVFLIKHTGPLLRCFAEVIDGILGTNLAELLDLVLDAEKTKKTQKVLLTFFSTMETKTLGFLDTNKVLLEDALDYASQKIEDLWKDILPNTEPKASPGTDNIVTKIFTNPIITNLMKYNPLMWIAESYAEEYSDLLKAPQLPSLEAIFTETLPNFLRKELKIVWDIVSDLTDIYISVSTGQAGATKTLLSSIKDVMVKLFDAFKVLVKTAYDVVTKMMASAFELMKGEWEIPILTAVYKALTDDQPFSMLNVFTYVVATILNVGWRVATGNKTQLPFDDGALPHPDSLLSGWNEKDDVLHDIFNIPRRAKQQSPIMTTGFDPSLIVSVNRAQPPPAMIAMGTLNNGSTVLASRASGGDTLDATAKEAKHKYEKQMAIAEIVGCSSRLFLCVLEYVEFGNHRTQEHLDSGSAWKDGNMGTFARILQAPIIIGAALTLASRIMSVNALQEAYHTVSLRNELSFDQRKWAIMLPAVANIGALISHFIATTAGNKAFSLTGNIILCLSTIFEQGSIDIIERSNMNAMKVSATVFECLASGAGIASQGLIFAEQYEFAALASAVDGACSVVVTTIVAQHFEHLNVENH